MAFSQIDIFPSDQFFNNSKEQTRCHRKAIFLQLKWHGRVAVVHLNFRAGSTFPVPVHTVSPGHWVNKAGRHSIGLAGATRLTRSDFRLNLLLLKGQRCVVLGLRN